MRFGIFYEHQLPRPWDEGAEQKLIADALDQIELADRLGIDYVWEVEHHFLEEYSHSSASEVFLAAASQRTQQIRLGFGIVAMPPGYQHPARVAEKVAMLDLVSGGRVEWGTGETSSGVELGGFGVERATKREQWQEALDVATRMTVEEPFAGHDGQFLRVPQRNVVPKPVQKPHPPLWAACSRRDTIRMAAENGLGALSFSFVEPEEAKEWVDEYYEIIASEQCVPAGFSVNPNFAVVLPMMCHHDEKTAIERGIDGAHFFGYSLGHYYFLAEHVPGFTNIWENFERNRSSAGFARSIVKPEGAPLGVKLLREGLGSLRGAMGTPEQITELLRRYEAAGVDQVIFVMQAGRNRHEHICESLELFADEVMPGFAREIEAKEEIKRERLALVVTAALERRQPTPVADPNYSVRPLDSGPPAVKIGVESRGSVATDNGSGIIERARSLISERGEAAFASFVRRSSDERLARTVGSDRGLKLMFGQMMQRFEPEKAKRFDGEVQYEIAVNGTVKPWTIMIVDRKATARPGFASDPKVTVSVSAPDLARLAVREIDRGQALVTGQLQVTGDIAFAQQLPDMFGEPV